MSSLLKVKLLHIAKSGIFNSFTPEQLSQCRDEILSLPTDKLSNIEVYNILELHFYISILTNHDVEAKACLDRLLDQFEMENSQRLKILQSIYLQAIGDETRAASILSQHPDELALSKRLTTFSRNKGIDAYVSNLKFYLDLNPSDSKAWAELGEVYSKNGSYDQSIYCYKEILLHEPFAYNIFYRVGLQHYYQFLQWESEGAIKDKKDKILEAIETLAQARDHFLRSIEISQNYVKGWEGVLKVCELKDFSAKLKSKLGQTKEAKAFLEANEKLEGIARKKVEQLRVEN